MKHLFIIILSILPFCKVFSQVSHVELYPQIPEGFNAALFDLLKSYPARVLKMGVGQYYGQVTGKGSIYGYGKFFTDNDGEAIGFFRNGALIFGIKRGSELARIGTDEHFAVYDLASGKLMSVYKGEEQFVVQEDEHPERTFVQFSYENGARYVGEAIGQNRDGYGTYYFPNGDYYFGRYSNNQAVGHGALFKTDNHIILQEW